jgi:hypothetical protein
MKLFVTSLFFVFLSLSSLAHEFHVGMCQVDYEEGEKMMYATIQLESWDFEHWLEDQEQNFNLNELAKNQKNSADWQSFEAFLFKYFSVRTNHQDVQFLLFELEIEADGRMFIYLVAFDVEPFESVSWHFSLLMGHSMEQQNKLEFTYYYEEKEQVYYAYFFENEKFKTTTILKTYE